MSNWLDRTELEPPRLVSAIDAVDLACDDGGWRGGALLIFEHEGWTVFEDLSGCLGAIPAEKWLNFAGQDSLVYAGYNDAIACGELVVIEAGRIERAFVVDGQEPANNRNEGTTLPARTWIDVTGLVDEDPMYSAKPEEALLWVLADPGVRAFL